jgi:hypothetical protein
VIGDRHHMRGRCDDCQIKRASFGVPGDRVKVRWCAMCARGHEGAKLVYNVCEDCNLKQASYGVLGAAKRRRCCQSCARAHEGARPVQGMCEDCATKKATCGMVGEQGSRARNRRKVWMGSHNSGTMSRQ